MLHLVPIAGGRGAAVRRLLVSPSGLHQPGAEKQPDIVLELPGRLALVTHEDPLEQGLVHQPADFVGGLEVDGSAVPKQGHEGIESLADEVSVARVGLQDGLGGGDLPSDARLLALEQVERDGLGVVGLEQLLLLGTKPTETNGFDLSLGIEACLVSLQVDEDEAAQVLGLGGRQANLVVEPLDSLFDFGDGDD